MLFEVYFDSRGEFRDSAKFGYADKPLSLVTGADFTDVLEFITHHLSNHTAHLKFVPGDRDRTTIQIVSAPVPPSANDAEQAADITPARPTVEVRSVLLGGVELMRNVVDENADVWNRMLRSAKLSPERIRNRISDELAIPKWALTLDTQPPIRADVELAIPEGLGFQPKLALAI